MTENTHQRPILIIKREGGIFLQKRKRGEHSNPSSPRPIPAATLISRRVASKIVGLNMRVFCHKRTRAAAQRRLLGFDVFGDRKSKSRSLTPVRKNRDRVRDDNVKARNRRNDD
jgi:hypothetical protein